jgi:hypothetical protein
LVGELREILKSGKSTKSALWPFGQASWGAKLTAESERLPSWHPPLEQAESWLRRGVMLEFAYNFGADRDRLARIPQKIADQPDAQRRGWADHRMDIGSLQWYYH